MATLQESIFHSAIRNVHFFNGRLLTERDMLDEQSANRQQRAQLGKAIGSGVVSGLEVRIRDALAPSVDVAAGCAINRLGEVLALEDDQEVILTTSSGGGDTADAAGLFSECSAAVSSSLGPTANGIFLLVMGPASGFEGEAPKHESFDLGTATGCGKRHSLRGVQFRLVRVNGAPTAIGTGNAAGLSKYRSRLAHWLFDSEKLAEAVKSPFPDADTVSQWTSYGPVEALLVQDEDRPIELALDIELLLCETPLAILWWDGSAGLRLLDMWPVRRRLVRAFADSAWPLHTQDRRIAEAEAVFLQFQDHLDWLKTQNVSPSDVVARDHFAFLSPAGLLPTEANDFRAGVFFRGFDVDRLEMDPASYRGILHASFFAEPIDLNGKLPRLTLYQLPGEAVDFVLFTRQENAVAIGGGNGKPTPGTEPPVGQTGDIEITLQVTKNYKDTFNPRTAKVLVSNDRLGKTFEAKYSPRSNRTFSRIEKVPTEVRSAVFKGSDLPVAIGWRIGAEVAGFLRTSRSSVSILPNQTRKEELNLVPILRKDRGSDSDVVVIKKPDAGQKIPTDLICRIPGGGWIDSSKQFVDIGIVCGDWKYPWDEPERFGPSGDPPPEALDEMIKVAEGFQKDFPDVPVDPGDPVIYYDGNHVPGSATEEPYAFLVLGKNGPFAPAIMTDPTTSLPARTPAGKAGLDLTGYESTLGELDIDMLAAAPESVLRSFGVNAAVVNGVQSNVRSGVTELQDSTLILGGVDSRTRQMLQDQGFATLTDLANADRNELAELVGSLLADRLIAESRELVLRETWALDDLSFGETDRAGLEKSGIDSKGALERVLASEEPPAVLIEQLGLSTEQIRELSRELDAAKTSADIAHRGSQSIAKAKIGLDAAALRKLARRGVFTVGQLERLSDDALSDAVGAGRLSEVRNQINAFLRP